jgi:hypothetical protein
MHYLRGDVLIAPPPVGARAVRRPISIMPGPPRTETRDWQLDERNAIRLQGIDEPELSRWADVAGNYYSEAFCRQFSYTDTAPDGPRAFVRLASRGETVSGRLELRGMKPNFAYQLKILGNYAAGVERYEAIGHIGRWRLPGRRTNFTYKDYDRFEDKDQVEAYVLFDYVVTDAKGDAVRDFALDSSLHVLWNALRQKRHRIYRDDALAVTVVADDPAIYARPKPEPTVEYIYAERETVRYRRLPAGAVIRLPPGEYDAFFAITEESFHSEDSDGGHWSTVLRAPVSFEVVAP